LIDLLIDLFIYLFIEQLPLMECSFPPLHFLPRRLFFCLRRTWCDGVEEVYGEGELTGNRLTQVH